MVDKNDIGGMGTIRGLFLAAIALIVIFILVDKILHETIDNIKIRWFKARGGWI
jgi:hypothetical protein